MLPSGGAANGMPLNTRTSGSVPALPETIPLSNFTGGSIAATSGAAHRRTVRKRIRTPGRPSYRTSPQSIIRGPLDAVDNENVDLSAGRFDFETELLPHGGKQAGSC